MWPFKKKPVPPQTPDQMPPINEDWAVGDQAQCIIDFSNGGGPAIGEVYSVSLVFEGRCMATGRPDWGLGFRRVPNPFGCMGYSATCFRKIVPKADEQSADEGFKALIKRVRKAPEPVPAQ